MTTQTKKLYDEAMKLSYQERAALAEQLWNSADEQEWMDELESRIDDVKSGRVKPIPIRTAFARLKKVRHGTSRKR